MSPRALAAILTLGLTTATISIIAFAWLDRHTTPRPNPPYTPTIHITIDCDHCNGYDLIYETGIDTRHHTSCPRNYEHRLQTRGA